MLCDVMVRLASQTNANQIQEKRAARLFYLQIESFTVAIAVGQWDISTIPAAKRLYETVMDVPEYKGIAQNINQNKRVLLASWGQKSFTYIVQVKVIFFNFYQFQACMRHEDE